MPLIVPQSIRASADGGLIVLSSAGGSANGLYKVLPDGRAAQIAPLNGIETVPTTSTYRRLAIDGQGNIYHTQGPRIYVTYFVNGLRRQFAGPGSPPSFYNSLNGANISTASVYGLDFGGPGGYVADANYLYYINYGTVLYRITLTGAQTGLITRIAGQVATTTDIGAGPGGDTRLAIQAKLQAVSGMALHGNMLFLACNNDCTVRAINLTTGYISTYAGTQSQPGSLLARTDGDGGPATASSVRLTFPTDVATDSSGNVYVSTGYGIRKIAPGNGTVGGTISTLYSTDWSPATGVSFSTMSPQSMAVQGDHLYVTESRNHPSGDIQRIWKVNLATGAATILVNGPYIINSWSSSWPGGGPVLTAPAAPSGMTATATSSSTVSLSWTDNSNDETAFLIEMSLDGLTWQSSTPIAVAPNQTTYVKSGLTAATAYYFRVRAMVSGSASTGATPAPQYLSPFSNIVSVTTLDTPLTAASAPNNLTATVAGTVPESSSQINLAWTDNSSNEQGFLIERATTGSFVQIAVVPPGTTTYSNTGLDASTTYQYRVAAYNSAGTSPYSTANSATTAAPPPPGTGAYVSPTETASTAAISAATDVAVDAGQYMTWTELDNKRIRKMDVDTKVVTTFKCYSEYPYGVVMTSGGRTYVSLSSSTTDRIYELTGSGLSLVAGTTRGFSGDEGSATSCALDGPRGLAVDSAGNIYVADSNNNRVRMINVATGIIDTVAGGGSDTTSEGISALDAQLSTPTDVAVDSDGNLYIAEFGAFKKVRKVSGGHITTFVGGGGDSLPDMWEEKLPIDISVSPKHVSVDAAGNVFVASLDEDGNTAFLVVGAEDGLLRRVGRNPFSKIALPAETSTAASLPHSFAPATNGMSSNSDGDMYFARSGAVEKVTVSFYSTPAEAPEIESFFPSSVSEGKKVSIAGRGFSPSAAVYFKSYSRPSGQNPKLSPVEWRVPAESVVFKSPNLIEARLPSSTSAIPVVLLRQLEVIVENPDGQAVAKGPLLFTPALTDTITADIPAFLTLDSFSNSRDRMFGLGTNVEQLFYSGLNTDANLLLNVRRRYGGTNSTTHMQGDLVFKGALSVHAAPFMYKVATGGIGQVFCLLRPDGSVSMSAYNAGSVDGLTEATEYAYASYQASLRKSISPLPKFEPEV